MNIICTKCKSDRVEHFTKEKPIEKELTMDDYANGSDFGVVNAVMIYTTMVLLCKDCNYRVEYTSPRTDSFHI